MIPKIIHFCWLSGDPYPERIQRCLDSWREQLPDYEFWLWDSQRFDVNATLWTRQAYEAKKWAFVADYIRLYAVYHYGGIYLDSDVMVYKSFDPLLHLPYFIGRERSYYFEAAVIGGEKGVGWMKYVLDHYADRPFIKADGRWDEETLPVIIRQRLESRYKIQNIHREEDFVADADVVSAFDRAFFSGFDTETVPECSYCRHLFVGSWVRPCAVTPWLRCKMFVAKHLPGSVFHAIARIHQRVRYMLHISSSPYS